MKIGIFITNFPWDAAKCVLTQADGNQALVVVVSWESFFERRHIVKSCVCECFVQLFQFLFLLSLRDLQVFEELFSFACPKFLSPVVPNYDNVHPNYHKEPFQQQLKVFAEEVQQQAQLSTIRRYIICLMSAEEQSSLFLLARSWHYQIFIVYS